MNAFHTDEQTLKDLEIFGDKQQKSLVSLLDATVSKGGELMLRQMLERPVADKAFLEARQVVIRYLAKYPELVDIDRNKLSFIEIYLEQEYGSDRLPTWKLRLRAWSDKIKPRNDWSLRWRGVEMLGELLYNLGRWCEETITDYAPSALQAYRQRIDTLLGKSRLREVLTLNKLTLSVFGKLDYLFRCEETAKIRELLDILYELEALRSVAVRSAALGFAFPEYGEESTGIDIHGVYHPFLSQAVGNDFCLNQDRHICFLTGPNMAGKSTYMKAVGICIYLAHVGFPVPAQRMNLSVFSGLFSTINLSDDINLGYSHYYSEVRRIKLVAEKMARLKNVVVIFDELFRGTNVRDAYEASLAVLSAFGALKRSMFIISTHILEVAGSLKHSESVDFRFFDIQNCNGELQYTYRLKSGVSDERLGMYILDREKVVETILKAAT